MAWCACSPPFVAAGHEQFGEVDDEQGSYGKDVEDQKHATGANALSWMPRRH